MKFYFLLVISLMGAQVFAGNSEKHNWTLRMKSVQGWRVVTTGCLGTASYAYRRPSVEDLLNNRKRLLEHAQSLEVEEVTVWAKAEGSEQDFLVVDLEAAQVREPDSSPMFPWPDPGEKHLVFCVCKTEHKNCGVLKPMPWPLGYPLEND